MGIHLTNILKSTLYLIDRNVGSGHCANERKTRALASGRPFSRATNAAPYNCEAHKRRATTHRAQPLSPATMVLSQTCGMPSRCFCTS